MFCPNCGKKIDDNSNFCFYCGNGIGEKKDNNFRQVKKNPTVLRVIFSVFMILMLVAFGLISPVHKLANRDELARIADELDIGNCMVGKIVGDIGFSTLDEHDTVSEVVAVSIMTKLCSNMDVSIDSEDSDYIVRNKDFIADASEMINRAVNRVVKNEYQMKDFGQDVKRLMQDNKDFVLEFVNSRNYYYRFNDDSIESVFDLFESEFTDDKNSENELEVIQGMADDALNKINKASVKILLFALLLLSVVLAVLNVLIDRKTLNQGVRIDIALCFAVGLILFFAGSYIGKNPLELIKIVSDSVPNEVCADINGVTGKIVYAVVSKYVSCVREYAVAVFAIGIIGVIEQLAVGLIRKNAGGR